MVVDDLLADVDRWSRLLERLLDDGDRPAHTRAESARVGQQHGALVGGAGRAAGRGGACGHDLPFGTMGRRHGHSDARPETTASSCPASIGPSRVRMGTARPKVALILARSSTASSESSPSERSLGARRTSETSVILSVSMISDSTSLVRSAVEAVAAGA